MESKNKINNLGTYVVRMKNINIRGNRTISTYTNYLINGEHDNHQDTKVLNTIGDKDKYIVETKMRIHLNKQHRKKVNRGRPLKVSSKSMTFNIPKDYVVSEENCIDIQIKLFQWLKNFYRENGYLISDSEIFSNIHYQSNSHINFIIPYLDVNGKILPFIKSKKRFFQKSAEVFTSITDEVLGTNIKDYMIEVDQMSMSDEIMDNISDLTLVEIQELKVKHQNNKLVKRTLDYVYKIINGTDKNQDIQKHIDNLKNTIVKIEKQEKKLTSEEYEDFVKALRDNKLLSLLSDEDKERIQDVKPTNTM